MAHPLYGIPGADRPPPSAGVAPPPGFFIVGAPRCGTTALSRAFKGHPAISFSKPKETHFFLLAPPKMADEELRATYLGLHHPDLAPRHEAMGDGSVGYLYSPEAIRRALRFDPRARFIAMVRNPLEMVPSYHARAIYSLDEDERDLARAWDLQGSRAAGRNIPRRCRDPRVLQYGEVGSLGKHVERLIKIAGRERCLIIVYDDLARDMGAVYRQVLKFLEIADDGRTSFARRSESRGFRSPFVQQFVMNPPSWTLHLIRFGNATMIQRMKRLRRRLKRFNTFPEERPALTPEMRAMLRAYFADDVYRLSALLSRDLTRWVAD
jgi:hypothetical protein